MPTLYPYQQEGVSRLVGMMGQYPGALLADEMGLGKTAQALEMINRAKVDNILVVCPASLKLNWLREFETWDTQGRVAAVADGKRLPLHADLIIINYDIVAKHLDELLDWEPGVIIFDEAHYLKNREAKRTQAALSIPCQRRLFVTGTPMVNRPAELWTMLQCILPDRFPDFHQYGLRYCGAFQMEVETKHGKRKVWIYNGAARLQELHQILKPFVVRRLKKDVLTELPPKTRQVIELSGGQALVSEEADEWDAVCRDFGYESAVAQLKEGVGPAFNRMAQVRKLIAEAKLKPVVEHIGNVLESTDKVVVFCHHRGMVAGLRRALPGDPAIITGATPSHMRQAEVDRFQSDPLCRVFIGNIRAAGVGITLTAASTVIFAELDWTPGNMTQAEDRCHRIGQRENVLVQHLVLEGSLDALMVQKLIEKQRTADVVIDGK